MKLLLAFALLLVFTITPIFAQQESKELELLRLELEQLKSRVESYQTEQSSINKKSRGLLELSSYDTVLIIGGRVELFSTLSAPDGAFFARRIPLESEQKRQDFGMDARASRFWVKTRTPTPYGPFLATIEIDFLGANPSSGGSNYTPRLRHAYLEFAGFGFGQTNSAFNSIVAVETITYAIDDTFLRQGTLRYSGSVGSDFAYDISLESPESSLFKEASDTAPQFTNANTAPDLILRARYYDSWGQVGLSYLSRIITSDDLEQQKYGWGTNLSGRVESFGLDDIRFNAHYGVGSGRYIAYNGFGAGVINEASGAMELTTIYGGHLGYRHWWSSSLRSTLALSYMGSQVDEENENTFALLTKETKGLQVNLYYTPVKNLLFALEYAYAKREVYSGNSGDMSSTNLLLRYDF